MEDIIKKSELVDEDEQKILASRILRRINTYEDILSKREEKFHLLLMKSMSGELEDSELQELEEIRLQKASPALAEELSHIKQIEEVIKAHEELLNNLKHFSAKEGNDVV